MTGPVAGKTAVVTGTAHGIGTAIAEALRDGGAAVYGADKDEVDLTDAAAVRDFFAALGGVDILVNNAGGSAGRSATRWSTWPSATGSRSSTPT